MSNIGTKFILAQTYTFDPNSNSLTPLDNENEIIRLGSNESRILLMLSERPNEVITRDELHEFVWRDQGFQVDDSSLTQAISTLRKQLNDSTKSPQFVKTVPKRGYQLISSVEAKSTEDIAEPIIAESAAATQNAPATEPQTNQSTAKAPSFWSKMDTATKVILLVALLLPFGGLFTPNSTPSQFREVVVVDSVPVKTTMGHPSLDTWIPSIELCVSAYLESYTDNEQDAIEVYATAGQNGQLYLSYIHPPEFTSENSTVRLIAEQSDLKNICN
ncbi:transcriptional regulator [Vibrio sp. qd031]|uniref:winged helix-turn-helix domain-containing protein n=1 Tax=Vibrio sp. qd031 TaxID=1603038 RepID=UPI000A10C42A|nr:transcriptional regulator [Vibrio sp. qd031]ORT50410.1 transcriptional regulator [Vibrio sp. qd031]